MSLKKCFQITRHSTENCFSDAWSLQLPHNLYLFPLLFVFQPFSLNVKVNLVHFTLLNKSEAKSLLKVKIWFAKRSLGQTINQYIPSAKAKATADMRSFGDWLGRPRGTQGKARPAPRREVGLGMGRGVTEEQRAKQKHVGMVFRLLPSILLLEVEKDSNNDAFKHIWVMLTTLASMPQFFHKTQKSFSLELSKQPWEEPKSQKQQLYKQTEFQNRNESGLSDVNILITLRLLIHNKMKDRTHPVTLSFKRASQLQLLAWKWYHILGYDAYRNLQTKSRRESLHSSNQSLKNFSSYSAE